MKKIPTLFERDWDGDRSRVTRTVHPGCEWVVAGEGSATRKIDGACCAVLAGQLLKRRELRKGEAAPAGFEAVGTDDETGKTVGWLPVGEGAEDQWFRAAWNNENAMPKHDGTYELVGPKVQGNPERFEDHRLVAHDSLPIAEVPRDFDGICQYLSTHDFEGIVWHHEDGRMAKIKARDFGIKRGKS